MNELEELDKLAAILQHKPPKSRREQIKMWKRINEIIPSSHEMILAALQHPYWKIRRNASEWLIGSQDPSVIQPLLETCHNYSGYFHIRISAVVRKMGQPAYAPLIAAIKYSKPPIRRIAAEVLSEQSDAEAMTALADSLDMIPYWSWEQIARNVSRIEDSIKAPLIEKFQQKLNHHNPKVRDRAALTLIHLVWAGQGEFLITCLDNPNVLIRREAARTISRLRELPSIEPLLSKINDPDSQVRGDILESIGLHGGIQTLDLLIKLLRGANDNSEFGQIRYAISKIGKPAIEPTKALLDDPDPRIREAGFLTLGNLNAVDDDVWLRVLNEPDFETQKTAVHFLARRVNWKTLIASIGYPNEEIRQKIAQVLAHRIGWGTENLKAYLKELFTLLDDPDTAIRSGAVLVLEHGDQSIQRLVQHREIRATYIDNSEPSSIINLTNPIPELRANAAAVLGHTRNIKSLDSLQQCLSDPEVSVRTASITALGRLGHPRAIKPLLPFLQDNDPVVRLATIEALTLIHYPHVVESLIPLL